MSQIAYANPAAAPPDLSALSTLTQPSRAHRAPRLVVVPMLISLGVQLLFFLAYWIPETSTFPGRAWWLTQLSLLASPLLTSAGRPQVPVHQIHSGLPGLLLLVCGVALWVLSQTRHWLTRIAMTAPVVGGLLTCVVTWVGYAVSTQTQLPGLAGLLMLGWLGCAAYGAYLSLLSAPAESRPRTWRSGIPLLVAYAVIGPLPTAVGRWLFAPELRDVAAGLQQNTTAGRLAALGTGATIGLYICGVGVGVIVWATYHCWRLRRSQPWTRRAIALLGVLTLTAAIGWPTTTAAARRTTTLMYASPAKELTFGCGSRVLTPSSATGTQPQQTMVVSGLGCRTVTFFSGYQQRSLVTLEIAMSPVRASTPDGRPIEGRMVSGLYGHLVVVAQTSRLDGLPNQLSALRTADGSVQWEHSCPERTSMGVRFLESGSTVELRCGDDLTMSFDPLTGPPR